MKKSIILATIIAAICAACANDTETMNPSADTKTITIAFQGDVDFTVQPFGTRGVANDLSALSDVWVFDYMDGQCRQTLHQSACDSDFGTPAISLAYGTHNLYFVASAGTGAEVNTVRPSISWSTIGDTFYKSTRIDVGDDTNPFLSVTLDRVATALRVRSIDNVPATATYVALQPDAWYTMLDYTTGEPNGYTSHPILRYDNISNSQPLELILYGLAPSGDYKNRVRIKTYSANGLIRESVAPAVPFLPNHVTVVTGTLFGATEDATGITDIYSIYSNVKVRDSWGADLEVEI